jgi:hypothetical protein
MNEDKDREDWTEQDERELGEPKEEPMPVQEEGLAVGLEAQDDFDPDVDPEIAAEVELQEETREAEGEDPDEPVETVMNFGDDDEESSEG